MDVLCALREIAIPIPGLAPTLDGYRIAQLSDIHFGVYVGEPERRSALALVGRARPDLVVLTGDLVDHDPAYVPDLGRLVRGLGELPIRDGVVVIPGNHDYYTGVEAVLDASRRAGARILRNAGQRIGDEGGAFGLVGVDDVWATRNGYQGGPDLERALAMVPADVPKVLLCHNPVFFPEVAGRVALQLSGHTHGGQVNLGLRPAGAAPAVRRGPLRRRRLAPLREPRLRDGGAAGSRGRGARGHRHRPHGGLTATLSTRARREAAREARSWP